MSTIIFIIYLVLEITFGRIWYYLLPFKHKMNFREVNNKPMSHTAFRTQLKDTGSESRTDSKTQEKIKRIQAWRKEILEDEF